MEKTGIGIYIHIPFCVQKCLYCDFLSFANMEDKIENYVNKLCQSIDALTLAESPVTHGDGFCMSKTVPMSYSTEKYYVRTVYFGGGTPSLLDPKYIDKILCKLKQRFDFKPVEVTLEANPGTLCSDKLKAYKAMGINRLSMGLQSANDDELKMLGRIHNYEDFYKNYNEARRAGFDNISVDIMTALPDQTKEKLLRTLEMVTELQPEHISAYSLILEEGTYFYTKYEEHPKERELYYLMKDVLNSKGYRQYEISNFSKPGYESKHNTSYWTGVPYLGFGLGASSYFNDCRFKNETDLNKYLSIANTDDMELIKDENNKNEEKNSWYYCEESLTKEDKMSEYMILGLRMMDGVGSKVFKDRFDEDIFDVYGNEINKLVRDELLCIMKAVETDDIRIALTKKGLDYGNYVFSRFL